MSKEKQDKQGSDIKSTATLQLSISFNLEASFLPFSSTLPVLQLIVPGSHLFPYPTIPSTENFLLSQLPKEPSKKEPVPVDQGADIKLVEAIFKEIDIPNPLGLVQQF